MKRRQAVKILASSTIGMTILPGFKMKGEMTFRKIPSSGQIIPVVGLGTWQTFDVGSDKVERKKLTEVLQKMHELGGSVIDSSPMYGQSERVVGDLTSQLDFQNQFFYATKVWTTGKERGIAQMRESFDKMKRETMDLVQIHNLQDWQVHMKTLKDWKNEGKIKYWGITHYTNSSHDQLSRIIEDEKPDFVQFNYAVDDRNAEKRLLNVAMENGTAVLINRPFGGGNLFKWSKGKSLPGWCADYHIESWGQFFLKYLISHPTVTCVIPGTSNPVHVVDNMKAGYHMEDGEKLRALILKEFK